MATMFAGRVQLLCVVSSYALALGVEALRLLVPRRPVLRSLGLAFGGAGLLAQVLYLWIHPPLLTSPRGSFLCLSLILAIFYCYGSIHHRRLAWGLFVLPLVLGLVALAELYPGQGSEQESWRAAGALQGRRFWGALHGILLLLAAVGVCVGFVVSLMYLLQAARLRSKVLPDEGLKLLSLERLEEMNRHALDWAFPLLTAGVIVGAVLLGQRADQLTGWADPRIVGASLLWLVFALVLYLRYGHRRLRGRRVAVLTILAFVLLVFTLASTHTAVPGVGR